MNILLINHYAGSPEMGMEFRPYYFAREWIKMGHTVHVMAADYSHLRIENPKISKNFETLVVDGIHYHWIHTNEYEGNGLKRALTMAQFVGTIWLNARKIADTYEPDIIITSSTYPLDTYAGQRIKKYTKGKAILVHEIHDMWPITPVELGGMSTYNPFIIMLQQAENSFCKKSDKVVSLLPCADKYLEEHGMAPEKFIHIANGVVEEEWFEAQPLSESIQKRINAIKEKHEKIICFFGSHTESYCLDQIIDALKSSNLRSVALLMVGGGIYKSELIKRANGAENIYFEDSIPKKCIPSLLGQMDIIYIGAVRNNMFRFGICMNKLFDSMMSGKPILYAVDAPNNYVADNNCGITVIPEDVGELVKGLNKMVSMTREELEQMGNNGRSAVLKEFTVNVLASKFISKVVE